MGQSVYNLRILYHVKSIIGVGFVTINKNEAEYRIIKLDHVFQYVIPIFERYPLLTSKYYNYDIFKQAAIIIADKRLSIAEKDAKLIELKDKKIPEGYISPAWSRVDYKVFNMTDAEAVVSKNWIIGFIEAKGSFNMVTKEKGRMVHSFEVMHKRDFIVCQALGYIFRANVVTKKQNDNTVITTKTSSIFHIVKYFNKAIKGIKSLEYRI